ncbi:MAG: hypothetical protein N4A62_20455 [Marinisporobacter sp.]|jgi:hypothetical protein|nr:hypothetical protein [Marinisporobacter sp.]
MYTEIIEIKDLSTNTKKEGIIRELCIDDIEEMIKLQNDVVNYLENKEMFITLSREEIEYIFDGNGYIFGLILEGKIFAYVGVVYPKEREDNLGLDLNLDQEDLEYVVHLETAVVHPKVRGNRMQFQLAKRVVEKVIELNQMKYILNTVSPLNIASIMTTLDLGLVIKDLKEKYNGKLRYVSALKIHTEKINFKTNMKVPIEDYKKQLELIKKGFVGISYYKCEEGIYLCYGVME